MSFPTSESLYKVLEDTWRPAALSRAGPWTIRDGQNGGQRVCAATVTGEFSDADFDLAETAMRDLGQNHLFMIRAGDENLDASLQARGYEIKDPVTLYAIATERLTGAPIPPVSSFAIWPPLGIMQDLWAEGGIDRDRIAVMDRATGAKTGILARESGRAAGTGFVGISGEVAMLHAIEVVPAQRRKGVASNIMRSAAHWAQNSGAKYVSLAVTDANLPANALYTSLGMTTVGQYHYRIKR
jgi:GNAT superfamily N-acetyltransferase